MMFASNAGTIFVVRFKRDRAQLGSAGLGGAWRSWARQGRDLLGTFIMTRPGRAWRGLAWLGEARQGFVRHFNMARHGEARPGKSWRGKAGIYQMTTNTIIKLADRREALKERIAVRKKEHRRHRDLDVRLIAETMKQLRAERRWERKKERTS
jgi:hypothetical protein